MALSLKDLNVQDQCEESTEFEVVDENGVGMDVFISVLGDYAEVIREAEKKAVDAMRRQEFVQAKKGKADFRPIDKDIDFSIEMAALRMTGWRNITDEFNHENAVLLCTVNPLIKDQVREASKKMANFTKG